MQATSCVIDTVRDQLKPLWVFRHEACGGMGYLETYLNQRHISYDLIHVDHGEPVPSDSQHASGLIFLGSTCSVNAGPAWIADEIALIQHSARAGVHVLGICFGGQLISKAQGGSVMQAPEMQVGWYRLDVTNEGKALFGSALPARFEVFEWHEDMFSIPPGGTLLFSGTCIKNQGFLHGRCLALQFHPEITVSKIQDCLAHHADGLRNTSACVQEREEMLEGLAHRVDQLHAIADRLFDWWLNAVTEKPIGAVCPR